MLKHMREEKHSRLLGHCIFLSGNEMCHLAKSIHHIVAIDQNLVYVYDHKVIEPLSKNVVHECAKCGGCINESKRHQKLI
jgi:hypothetical protein